MSSFERIYEEKKKQLLSLVQKEAPFMFSPSWWHNKAMGWVQNRPELRFQLLKFVESFPALNGFEDVNEHWQEYLVKEMPNSPLIFRMANALSGKRHPVGARCAAWLAERVVRAMAGRFITDFSEQGIKGLVHEPKNRGALYTFDILGEAVLSEAEADEYQEKYLHLIDLLFGMGLPVDISLKLSSLYSQFNPLDQKGSSEAVRLRMRPILRRVKEHGGTLIVDMEQYYYRSLTLNIFMEALAEPEFLNFSGAGIAHQAYLKDSEDTLRRIISFAKNDRPITVRIVKGAYWDYEVITAQQKNWPVPVYTEKKDTDLSFERNVDIALRAWPKIKTAIGSHNISSIAYAMAKHQQLGLPRQALEVQVLYGLGNDLVGPVIKMGYLARIYIGLGDLLEGMSYLARRLLENTSQASSAFFTLK